MGKLFANQGTKIHIGPELASDGTDMEAADFTTGTPTWVEIGGTTDLGSFGDTAQSITVDEVNSGRTRKLKGTRNAGAMTVVASLDYSDAGQIALIAAEKSEKSYAFRVTFNDAPTGGTPSIRYFVGYVMSTQETLSGPNNVQQLTATIEIDSNIVRVAAAASGG